MGLDGIHECSLQHVGSWCRRPCVTAGVNEYGQNPATTLILSQVLSQNYFVVFSSLLYYSTHTINTQSKTAASDERNQLFPAETEPLVTYCPVVTSFQLPPCTPVAWPFVKVTTFPLAS